MKRAFDTHTHTHIHTHDIKKDHARRRRRRRFTSQRAFLQRVRSGAHVPDDNVMRRVFTFVILLYELRITHTRARALYYYIIYSLCTIFVRQLPY